MSKGYIILRNDLKGDYKAVFEKVMMYAECNNMEGAVADEMLNNLIDSLLTAQSKEEPYTKVTGADIESFCKVYFQDYSWQEKLEDGMRTFFGVSAVMFFISLVWLMMEPVELKTVWSVKQNILPYLVGVAVAVIIKFVGGWIGKKILFKLKKANSTLYDLIIIVSMYVALFWVFTLFGDKMSVEVPTMWILIITGSVSVTYLVRKYMTRYTKTGRLSKEKSPKTGMADSKDMRKNVYEGWLLRYNRINKRRSKRNKELLTEKEYTNILRKEYKFIEIFDVFAYSSMGIFVAIGIFKDTSVLDSVGALLILLVGYVIACCIGFGIYNMFSMRWFRGRYKEIMDICLRDDVSVFEYLKQVENYPEECKA
ncbi:MAG: hypothetical protein IJB96_06710 [Lachnospira sp.]|nr:hypothetical protein [Lachnospira sp.]